MVRTLAAESEDYMVSLSVNGETEIDQVAGNIAKVARTLLQPQTDPEDECCEIEGKLCISRVVDDAELVAQALPSE
jgi:hypothetical protein